jgi:hypothetical protein
MNIDVNKITAEDEQTGDMDARCHMCIDEDDGDRQPGDSGHLEDEKPRTILWVTDRGDDVLQLHLCVFHTVSLAYELLATLT